MSCINNECSLCAGNSTVSWMQSSWCCMSTVLFVLNRLKTLAIIAAHFVCTGEPPLGPRSNCHLGVCCRTPCPVPSYKHQHWGFHGQSYVKALDSMSCCDCTLLIIIIIMRMMMMVIMMMMMIMTIIITTLSSHMQYMPMLPMVYYDDNVDVQVSSVCC